MVKNEASSNIWYLCSWNGNNFRIHIESNGEDDALEGSKKQYGLFANTVHKKNFFFVFKVNRNEKYS